MTVAGAVSLAVCPLTGIVAVTQAGSAGVALVTISAGATLAVQQTLSTQRETTTGCVWFDTVGALCVLLRGAEAAAEASEAARSLPVAIFVAEAGASGGSATFREISATHVCGRTMQGHLESTAMELTAGEWEGVLVSPDDEAGADGGGMVKQHVVPGSKRARSEAANKVAAAAVRAKAPKSSADA